MFRLGKYRLPAFANQATTTTARVTYAPITRSFSKTSFDWEEKNDDKPAAKPAEKSATEAPEKKQNFVGNRGVAPNNTNQAPQQFRGRGGYNNNNSPAYPREQRDFKFSKRVEGNVKQMEYQVSDVKVAEKTNDETGEKLQTTTKTVKKWERRQFAPNTTPTNQVTKVERVEEQQEIKVRYTGKPGQFQRRIEGDKEGVKQIASTPDAQNNYLQTVPKPGNFVTQEPQQVSRSFERDGPSRRTPQGTYTTKVTGREDVRQFKRMGVQAEQGSLKEVRETTTFVRKREEKVETLNSTATPGQQQQAPVAGQQQQPQQQRPSFRTDAAGRGRNVGQFIARPARPFVPRDQQQGATPSTAPSETSTTTTRPPYQQRPPRPFTARPQGSQPTQYGSAPRPFTPRGPRPSAPKEADELEAMEVEEDNSTDTAEVRQMKIEKKKQIMARKYEQAAASAAAAKARQDKGRQSRTKKIDAASEEFMKQVEELEKVEETNAALTFGDEDADMLSKREILALLTLRNEIENTKYLTDYYEQNMNNTVALGAVGIYRDANPTQFTQELQQIQQETKDKQQAALSTGQITEEEARLHREAFPALYKSFSSPKAKTSLEYMLNPQMANDEYTTILKAIEPLPNYAKLESMREIQFGKLKEAEKLTPEYLAAFSNNIPANELLDDMVDDMHLAVSAGAKLTPELAKKVITNRLTLGKAARKHLSQDEAQHAEMLTAEMRKQSADFLMLYTPFDFTKALITQEKKAQEVPKVPESVDPTLTPEQQAEKDNIMNHHLVVHEKRVEHTLSSMQGTYFDNLVDMPHIQDTVATYVAGKYGKLRILAPMQRNFDDIIESVPEGPSRDRLISNARALAKNISLTLTEKKSMLRSFKDSYVAQRLDDTFEQPSAIRPGRRTHMHPSRQNPRDKYSIKTNFQAPSKAKKAETTSA